ncbi:MAG: hypothetical protein IJ644_04645 [Oscillospiraceae bacterium]|nr:hypothetical protein [Oscillospiraceae bacterium]
MKRELHDLLRNLVDDSDLPPSPEISVSEESRQKVDAIVEKMNREQASAPTVPKPVYDAPPSRKRPPVVTPDPVSHFSEEPSQNPVVRMHDRLLGDALPQPDFERKPVSDAEQKHKKSKHKKRKKTKAETAPETAKPKKNFHIEIRDELPSDVPRDTSIADRLKQEKLEAVLAATPPRTPEQIRKDKIRRRAEEIRRKMKQAVLPPDPLPEQEIPEPEEEIPAWEDALSEFSKIAETEHSAQLKFLRETESPELPALSEMPEIPAASREDAGLKQMSERLSDVTLEESETAGTEFSETESSRKSGKKNKKSKKHKKSQKNKKMAKKGFIGRIFAFWEKVFTRDTAHIKEPSPKELPVPNPEVSEPEEEPVFYQPPEKVTEVHIRPEQPPEEQEMNLDFSVTATFRTVSMQAVRPKEKKKVPVSRKKRKNHHKEN